MMLCVSEVSWCVSRFFQIKKCCLASKSTSLIKYARKESEHNSHTSLSLGRHITTMSTNRLPKYAAGSQPVTVLVEGNIGSGKTTLLNHFNKFQDDICLITEPVDKYRNCNGINLLELMYTDPNLWAMPFQKYVTLTMLQSHTMTTDKSVKLMERSLYSGKHCFVEILHKNKTIHEGMYEILKEWYNFIEQSIHIQADLIVYLRTSPEVVYERMRRRARSEESCVSLKYLQELHELHEDWLMKKIVGPKVPVLVLDGDLDLEHIGTEYKRSEEKIFNFTSAEKQPIFTSPSKRLRLSS